MATQEKFLKSLEILKKLSSQNTELDSEHVKKDKIQHCHIITECISSSVLQTIPNFLPMALSYAMEILFELCDDCESDVRMVAEENLNKIIRVVNDENITKVLIELHKEIKRNKSSRSLRAALSRFYRLVHYIRPHKGKPYVFNLFPSLRNIVDRPEEAVHETLCNSLPSIIEVLGPFTTDNDIKNLLKSFMANISNPSAVIRRSTANSIKNICLNCPKPYLSIVYCINIVLGFMFPLDENCDMHLNLGVMSVLKALLPIWGKLCNETSIKQEKEKVIAEWGELDTDKFIQIYELCVHYVNHKDHNVVISSIETLNILLQNSTKGFRKLLLNPVGITSSTTRLLLERRKSTSQLSITSSIMENTSKCDLTDSITPDISKWINESKLTVLDTSPIKSKEILEKSQYLESSSNNILASSFCQMDLGTSDENDFEIKFEKDGSKDDLDLSFSSEKSLFCDISPKISTKDVNIGSFDDQDIPLKYTARLLAKSFLLTGTAGHLSNDGNCRISIKSSAISCLSSILRIYPKILLEYLDKNVTIPQKEVDQRMSDLLLFSSDNDPQLRGNIRLLIAKYILSAIHESKGLYDRWLEENSIEQNDCLRLKKLICIFTSGLNDQSSLCVRNTLQSLEVCIESVLESEHYGETVPLLLTLPDLVKSPYWLVRVNLCNLVSSLPYVTLHYIIGNDQLQKKILYGTMYELLKDADVRVRKATSNAFSKLIPILYFEEHVAENAITAKAISSRKLLLSNLFRKSWISPFRFRQIVDSMPFPFNKVIESPLENNDFALSKVILYIYEIILSSNSKYALFGCIETLASMSKVFPCTSFGAAWSCSLFDQVGHVDKTNDLLRLCIDLMNNSELVYEIGFHTNLLILCSNLYAGFSVSILRFRPENFTKKWNVFESSLHSKASEQFLRHVVKILNIYHQIVDDLNSSTSQSKSITVSLPTASPLKRRKSDLEKKFIGPSKIIEEKNDKKEKEKNLLGGFSNLPHYIRIYEALNTAYGNYKTSLEPSASEKFLLMLKESLRCLSILLEVGILPEFESIAEEVLSYLNSTFRIEPSATIECVQQLLKSVFGTNLATDDINIIKELNEAIEKVETTPENLCFYHSIFSKPYHEISMCINSLKDINKRECDGDSTVMGYLHRNTHKNIILGRNLDKVLANYIRIFEPMVIKSLKQYTITSDVKLQVRVLHLLSQLVQLKINYCLLDADQIFINFVMNQFVYIEEGQIRHSQDLVRKIFQFLVQLSYSKQHSKNIISIPKILHLCDGLFASGQCPLKYCIPALEPIVEDIFLTRNASNISDLKELETTREVILSMLLKLVEYYQVIDLLILILDDSKYCSDADKWLRWSQDVLNSFLASLKTNKYKLDNIESLNAVRKLIFSLNPQVFRHLDDIILLLFQEPPSIDQDLISFTRWMGKIIIILMILSPIKEDIILFKISLLKNHFDPNSVSENVVTTLDPLNATNNADFFQHLSPELILIRFVFRTVTLATKKCLLIIEEGDDHFFIEELSIFMIFCLYNFSSGFLCKASKTAISILGKGKQGKECDCLRLDVINNNFRELIFYYPTLILQWCYFLTVMGNGDQNFWSSICQPARTNIRTSVPINSQVVKVGGMIVLCDYLCENSAKEDEELFRLLENELDTLIEWNDEPPVKEFLSSIHRSFKFSNQLLTNFEQQNFNPRNLIFNLKILKSIESIHPHLIGDLIKLLLRRIVHVREPLFRKEISKQATRKLEVLSTMSLENIHKQLSKDDIGDIIPLLRDRYGCRHDALLGLLEKLRSQFHYNKVQNNELVKIDFDLIKNLNINEKWYLSEVKSKINSAKLGKEVAEMMAVLDYEEQIKIMQDERIDIIILKDCLEYGVYMHKNIVVGKIPDILRASVDCLYAAVKKIVDNFPEPFQIFHRKNNCYQSEVDSSMKFTKKFDSAESFEILPCIIPTLSYYLDSIQLVPSIEIRQEDPEIILQFSILSLEFANYLTEGKKSSNIDIISYTLRCFNCILKHNGLFIILNSDAFRIWSCSAVFNIYDLVNNLLKSSDPSENLCKDIRDEIIDRFEKPPFGEACSDLYNLLSLLYWNNSATVHIPSYLLTDLKGIIVSLARLSIFNSYMLVPARVWKKGWDLGTFTSSNPFPILPIELLQEVDILEEYIFRITLLGWTSKQQFEETWMCLLSVLCNVPSDGSTPEEIYETYACTSLSIKGITSLLVQTLYQPTPGRGSIANLTHVSRNTPIACNRASVAQLKAIHLLVKNKYMDLPYFSENNEIGTIFDVVNLEKQLDIYTIGGISIKYFLIAVGILENIDPECSANKKWNTTDTTLQKHGLDVSSCLHFLQDFYSQLIQFQQINSLSVLHEIVASVLVLSDLFSDKLQFSWMLDLFLNLLKNHTVEEELIQQYLIIGVCKATAVINPELEVYENLKKYLVQFFKSPSLSLKIACLRGLLYILEGCILSNISIGGISEELQLILPSVVEYIKMNLKQSDRNSPQNQEHSLLVWIIAFYIIENIEEVHVEADFSENVLHAVILVLSDAKGNREDYKCVLKGLQRLIVLKPNTLKKIGKSVVKVSLDGLRSEKPMIAMCSMQLLFTHMYIECGEHVESQDKQTTPENLVPIIERFSALFEYIKRGYITEVEIICSLLPQLLDDFFTPADILTKVISEFLSTQQPHQKLLSRVIFHLFQNSICRNQLTLLQDWVVFSLPNFTQNFSYPMATWYLTCFFISASSNKWLTCLFPYIQTRLQLYEHEDREMLCIAGLDFYRNLSNDKQKETFKENFRIVKDLPEMPFTCLYSCL